MFLFVFLFSGFGCSYSPRDDSKTFPTNVADDDGSTTAATFSSTGDGTTSSSSSTSIESTGGEPKYDVQPLMSASCNKLDILFVIDNSGSMADNQSNLIENYQGFIDSIVGLTGYEDFHVGIITTDNYQQNGNNCTITGGLVIKTGGIDSSDMSCGPWSEGNYMTTSEVDQKNGFTCAAQVGSSGSTSEVQIESFLSSLGPFLNSEEQCNHGFYRDDAKLIVVFITDEDDATSTGSLSVWLDEIEFYKGNLSDVITVGLVPLPESECVASTTGTKLKDFILSFPHSILGDVCSTDYSIFFNDAIETIEQACSPEG